VKEPEEALEAARRAASSAPAEPEIAEASELGDPTLEARRLVEWAIIDAEQARVYSTRRYGKPITIFKRMLVRVLRQYLDEVNAQQSRFNALVAAHVMRLQERVELLEQERDERADREGP
jgi:hypothetical protein